MVSVNGVSYGVFTKYQLDNGQKTVQLHDGDAVRVARIPTPIQGYEASSGYDTTAWFYSTTSQISDFGSSLAAIQIDRDVYKRQVIGKPVRIRYSHLYCDADEETNGPLAFHMLRRCFGG